MAKQISFINIDDTTNDYFSTQRQIAKRKISYFTDISTPSLTGSQSAVGILENHPITAKKIPQVARNYLSSSASFDAYRSGVNILNSAQWAAGIVKISAGTPGHIIEPLCLGVNKVSILSADAFVEIEPFNPVIFVGVQHEGIVYPEEVFTFPIVTSDNNQSENYILNGIIEPIPIRSVVSNFSINAPFEPQGVRGGVGNGNEDHRLSADQVLTVDYYEPQKENAAAFLDSGETLDIRDDEGKILVPGISIGYFYLNPNVSSPFVDEVLARDVVEGTSYANDLIEAIAHLSSSTATYITRKQRSASTGFMYDNVNPAGTDSIAFGGMTY